MSGPGKDIKIHNDMNSGEDIGPHYDVVVPLPEIGGADKLRIREDGTPIDGSTQIGEKKVEW